MSSRNPSLATLSPAARTGLIIGVVVEVSAKIAAWVDLSRRPAEQVRGPKRLWALAQLINGLGPAAYWSVGRK